MEPDWAGHTITADLVDGDANHGWALYFDYGCASGAPTTGDSGDADNGWRSANLAWVSYSGLAYPLPEIYYTVNSEQWTVIRANWNDNNSSDYYFWERLSTEGLSGSLTPAEGWNALESRNSGWVGNELVDFGLW